MRGGLSVGSYLWPRVHLRILFSNECVPKEYILVGLSPFHACVFSLFLIFHNKFLEVLVNNIYMSKKCVHLLYIHKSCIKVQDFCQTCGQVIPR